MIGLLPCLRRGSDRWWLPRSAETTETLSHVMLAVGRGGDIPSTVRSRVIGTLHRDPAFFIYAALGWPGEEASLGDLADWVLDNITGRYASGDAFFGAPSVDQTILQRWQKLSEHYRTLSPSRWLDDASLWLEVTGPRVSNTWQEQWPAIERHDDDVSSSTGESCMLQQLARMMQRQKSMQQSFDQRLHKSKMGALKQLAYGLSHEINNPLANISTRAQQLQRNETDPTRHAVLQRIVEQVYRAHQMIADLMFFANPPNAQRTKVDLNTILEGVAEDFSEEVQRQAIRLELRVPPQPTLALVDETMIAEAVRALVRNSVEAIGCEGTIVLSLVRQDGKILIHVADSGPGLSDFARQHAFDPYFSGREAGRGLGLGLCRSYRIAKLHFGDVTLAGGPIGCVATITLRDAAK